MHILAHLSICIFIVRKYQQTTLVHLIMFKQHPSSEKIGLMVKYKHTESLSYQRSITVLMQVLSCFVKPGWRKKAQLRLTLVHISCLLDLLK